MRVCNDYYYPVDSIVTGMNISCLFPESFHIILYELQQGGKGSRVKTRLCRTCIQMAIQIRCDTQLIAIHYKIISS